MHIQVFAAGMLKSFASIFTLVSLCCKCQPRLPQALFFPFLIFSKLQDFNNTAIADVNDLAMI